MSNPLPLHGTHTALATPIANREVDYYSLERLVQTQVQANLEGVVAVGTTGESPTLSHEEHSNVIKKTVEFAKGSATLVIAGSGSNSTREAEKLSRGAQEAGADALLLVAPYYNKPSQEGLFLHFSRVASAVEIPIILYSIPGRCGIEIGVDTCARLYEKFPHVRAIKEAGGSCDRVSQLHKKLGKKYTILSGDDSLTLPFMSVGAQGVISVASNVVPGKVKQLVDAALQNDFQSASYLHRQHYDLFTTLFIESNPVPIKALLKEMGIITDEQVRLPLAPITTESRETLLAVARRLGLISE
jgi:4-hydroxy-tetrahydrodipicolinate synthase